MGKKLTTKQAAQLLGVHPDTMRKRAKAKKVAHGYNVLGHLEFDEDVILALLPKPAPVVNTDTKVIFVIDQSSSMNGLQAKMKEVITGQLAELAGLPGNVQAGHILFDSYVHPFSGFTNILNNYQAPLICPQMMTALNDAVVAALEVVRQDMLRDSNSAYLVMVITDGQDNSSRVFDVTVAAAARELIKTDRLTLVGNGPTGSAGKFTALGVPAGNIQGWTPTVEGLSSLGVMNTTATQSYSNSRSVGVLSSTSFYANVPDDVTKVLKQLDNSLDDITKQVVTERVAKVDDKIAIRNFANKKFGHYEPGKVYYELTKSEKVQEYKGIIVQDKRAGKFYQGWDTARKLLGLPAFQKGEIRVKPGKLGDFVVFVQSTSYNRKLPQDTIVIKLP